MYRRRFDQLAPGGRRVIPVGPDEHRQELVLVTRGDDGQFSETILGAVWFVSLVGEDGWARADGVSNSLDPVPFGPPAWYDERMAHPYRTRPTVPPDGSPEDGRLSGPTLAFGLFCVISGLALADSARPGALLLAGGAGTIAIAARKGPRGGTYPRDKD